MSRLSIACVFVLSCVGCRCCDHERHTHRPRSLDISVTASYQYCEDGAVSVTVNNRK